MTLYINVLSAQDLLEGGILLVEGSRAGLLTSKNIGTNHRFNPPFLVKCASDDTLSFKFVRSLQNFQRNQIISFGSLHAQSLTKRYKAQLNGAPARQSGYVQGPGSGIVQGPGSSIIQNQQTPPSTSNIPPSSYLRNSIMNGGVLQYDIQLYTKADKFAGVLHTTITYDPVSHFQGQFCSGAHKQKLQIRQKVALFKGKCPTKNLFSMLDPACQGQQHKFMESIYKDGDVYYRDY